VRLVLVTKGDLFHQEAKLGLSGLKNRFSGVEIVSDKTADSFRRIFVDYAVAPESCAMVGDSIRSDVLPALEAGAWAAFVPHDIVWFYERANAPVDHPRFKALETLADLPGWIDGIA
jgi:putative hydrolase of the HAD superfamily